MHLKNKRVFDWQVAAKWVVLEAKGKYLCSQGTDRAVSVLWSQHDLDKFFLFLVLNPEERKEKKMQREKEVYLCNLIE